MSNDWTTKPYPKNPDPPDIALPRTLNPPKAKKGFYSGADVLAMKRGVSRAGRWPWAPPGSGQPNEWDDGYADTFAGLSGVSGAVNDSGVKGVQRQSAIDMTGILGKHTFEVLRTSLVPDGLLHAGEPLFDSVALDLLASYKPAGSGVPDLGPVYSGGKSVLDHDCTHITGGLPDYPAFDDCFQPGRAIIAPEDLQVTGQSSSSPGDAFYAKGASKLKYWFGHLTSSPANGQWFDKGQTIGYVLDHNQGGGPHVHVGIDARDLIGKPLQSSTNYTHNGYTIGEQLAAAL